MGYIIFIIIDFIVIAVCWYWIGYNKGKQHGFIEGALKNAKWNYIEVNNENELDDALNKILDSKDKKDD